jgi:RimJ/RimL family protein N-acetyltransferase
VTDAEHLAVAISASLEHLRPWMAFIAHEPMSLDDRVALIARWDDEWAAGGDVVFGAFLGDVIVGGCGLHRRAGPDTLEIGYWVHADHIGHGYATEIARGLTDAAFGIPGIDRVEIHHDEANVASGRVPARLGFEFAGRRADQVVAPAEVGVDMAWSMRKSAWLRSASQQMC